MSDFPFSLEIHHAGTATFLPWIENLIGNLRSGESELLDRGLATEEQIQQGISELQQLMHHKAASAFFYWIFGLCGEVVNAAARRLRPVR